MRANERLKDIKAFHEYHKNPIIETEEILDRGIHVVNELLQINIKEQLLTLQSSLDNIVQEQDFDLKQLEYAKDLSKFIFVAMIVNKGILASEIFGTNTNTLEMIHHLLTNEKDAIERLEHANYMDDLRSTIKNISKDLNIWIDDK